MQEEKKYQWHPYFRNPIVHTNIQLVVDEIEAIREAYNTVSPQLLVDSAKNKKSVIHSYFNWDDTDAANKYRVSQANLLLRHIEVKIISNEGVKTIRVYETVTKMEQNATSTYIHHIDASKDTDAIIIKRILADLRQIKTRLERVERVDVIKHILQAILVLQTSTSEETGPVKEQAPPILAAV